jgi:Putative sensor
VAIMGNETFDEAPVQAGRGPLAHFLLAPLEVRSYGNLLFLALSFPLGLIYFIFLSTGLAVGFGLTLIWIGLPILAVVFAVSWGMMALERQLAIHLLGASVPPMAAREAAAPRGLWRTVSDFFGNPVTWKGLGYLLIKLPLGIVTFTVSVTLLSLSAAFLLLPFASNWGWGNIELDGWVWTVDTPAEAVLCVLLGLLIAFLSLHALNGLAWVWRVLASSMLGSRRFAVPPAAGLAEPAAAG